MQRIITIDAGTADEIKIGSQIRLRSTSVEPVVVGLQCEQGSLLHKVRKCRPFDRQWAITWHRCKRRRLEHIGAGVDMATRRRAGGGLFDKPSDKTVGCGFHHAVLRRVSHRRQVDCGEGSVGAVPLMRGDEIGDTQVGDDVAVGDDEWFVAFMQRHRACGEADRSGGVKRRVFDSKVQTNTRTSAVWKRRQKRFGLEAECQNGIGDAAPGEMHHQPFENGALAERQERLGNRVGERP